MQIFLYTRVAHAGGARAAHPRHVGRVWLCLWDPCCVQRARAPPGAPADQRRSSSDTYKIKMRDFSRELHVALPHSHTSHYTYRATHASMRVCSMTATLRYR